MWNCFKRCHRYAQYLTKENRGGGGEPHNVSLTKLRQANAIAYVHEIEQNHTDLMKA